MTFKVNQGVYYIRIYIVGLGLLGKHLMVGFVRGRWEFLVGEHIGHRDRFH